VQNSGEPIYCAVPGWDAGLIEPLPIILKRTGYREDLAKAIDAWPQ
jgi:hypothetical protein